MSQSDREFPKCRKSVIQEGHGSDLSLCGSQVSLVSRPRSVTGKASVRALAVSGPRIRRPLSAVPTMSLTEITRDKRRPYSADSQLLFSSYQKRNKLSACFSMSADPMSFSHQDIEADGDIEFSSSTLVSSQLSGGAWMELEMRGLYLRHSDPNHPLSSTDNGSDLLCSSELSEDQTRSEKSLGEQIQAMVRDRVQHDQALSANSSSFQEKKQEDLKSKSEKSPINDDPKKMSTKELHLRMVESGLIPISSSYLSKYSNEGNEASKIESPCNHEFSTSTEIQTHKKSCDSPKRNGSEFESSANTSKSDPFSYEFWNHHEYYQPANKSTCGIDQIRFPKEHDVDSLGGDSSCSNNGMDSQRKGKDSASLKFHSQHENIQWPESDLGPVRFQQWVTDTCKANNANSNGLNPSSSFFCGTRMSPSNAVKDRIDYDCTVEEVSTDSEFSKPHQSSCKMKTEAPTPDNGLLLENSCSDFAMYAKNEKLSAGEGNDQRARTEDDCFPKDSSADTDIKVTDTYLPVESLQVQSSSSCAKENTAGVLSPYTSQAFESAAIKKEENFVKKNDKKLNCNAKLNVLTGKKVFNTANDVKKEIQLHHGTKRRNDLKGNGSSSKCGKNPLSNSNRSFSPPKEETFPAETQTELLSWMSLCSDDHMEKNSARSNHTGKEPQLGVADSEDSPYNEIMTILRVLEEKEDESSLLRILNKRSELRTPQDPSFHDAKSVGPTEGSHPAHISPADQTDSEVSRSPSQPSAKNMDSSNQVCPDIPSAEKQEMKTTQLKPSAAMCSSDAIAQPAAQGELRDLLTFLDAVDQSCSAVLQPNLPSHPRPSPRVPRTSVETHNLEELLLMGRSDLAQEIVSLRLALEDRDATINLLRTALREQKDSQTRQNAAHNAELANRIREVKSECEAVIKRHQKFIDQLIADKASLSQKCESLVQESKDKDEKHAKAVSILEDKHKVEMQRVKDITAATEKLKRERWVENKTQKIKELTVRGLEPELSRLTSQHEQEMSALRTLHAQELEQMEARAARRASQQMEALREQLVQEKEVALTREREMLRQRMEKQQLLFEEEGAEQRRRLVAEVRREQDRLATLEARLEAQFEERKRGLDREVEQDRERMRRDYADKLSEMHRKQQNEILQYREALKAEKEAWMDTYQQQQKQSLLQTTNEIREQLKRERDREIEVVIERLENEATLSREEKEKTAENRLRRVREQLTSELRDVESALNSLKEKHAELRSQLQEKEDKLVSSEALNRSLHTQLVETQKIADQLSTERADLKQALQCEIIHELECLRQQLAEQHARHQQQLQILSEQSERERQTHQQELQQLFDRVKLAISKKEEVVKVAKGKQKAAEEQISHLQALLEHRRKESLMS